MSDFIGKVEVEVPLATLEHGGVTMSVTGYVETSVDLEEGTIEEGVLRQVRIDIEHRSLTRSEMVFLTPAELHQLRHVLYLGAESMYKDGQSAIPNVRILGLDSPEVSDPASSV